MEHYEPTFISFAGTGTSSGVDATAANYTVASPGGSQRARCRQLVEDRRHDKPLRQGPPDFTATTVTQASALPQKLIIEWAGNGSPNPFTDLAAQGLFINLNDTTLTGPTAVGAVHVIEQGPQTTDVLDLPNPNPALLVVVPASLTPNPQYLYTVGNVTNNLNMFSDPATFAQSIQYFTGAVNTVTKLVATGQYDGAGHFVATNIEISIY